MDDQQPDSSGGLTSGAAGSQVCLRCEAPGQGGNFCVACGYDLRPAEPRIITPRHRRNQPPPAVIACPACGAANAESRRLCARCQSLLREPAPEPQPPAAEPRLQPDLDGEGFGPAVRTAAASLRPRGLSLVLVISAVVLLGVTVTLMAARGLGPFDAGDSNEGFTTALTVRRVEASSSTPGHPAAALADGDPATAWVQGQKDPGEATLSLELAQRSRLRRLVVWNGDQDPTRFTARNRVKTLRIQVDQERFVVELLDTRGRQVVELPRSVVGDSLRLTILATHDGTLESETALSEVEVHGTALR